jgi:hypothetical protein
MSLQRTNWFWAGSFDLNFIFYFLKHFVKMCLAISFTGVQISYFSDLQIKSYRCLKILGEIWAEWACIGANEEELTTCVKIW